MPNKEGPYKKRFSLNAEIALELKKKSSTSETNITGHTNQLQPPKIPLLKTRTSEEINKLQGISPSTRNLQDSSPSNRILHNNLGSNRNLSNKSGSNRNLPNLSGSHRNIKRGSQLSKNEAILNQNVMNQFNADMLSDEYILDEFKND